MESSTASPQQQPHDPQELQRAARREYHAQWRQNHPESLRESQLRWHRLHPGVGSRRSHVWAQVHPIANRESKLKWSRTHREQMREYSRAWRAANPERVRASKRRCQARREARKAGSGGTYDASDLRCLWSLHKGRCWWCGDPLGDSLESAVYHVDHRFPVIAGGENSPNNLCLACPRCNMKKHAKMPWEFMPGRLL